MNRATADFDAAAKRYLGNAKPVSRWRGSETGDKSDKARLDMLQAEVCSLLQPTPAYKPTACL